MHQINSQCTYFVLYICVACVGPDSELHLTGNLTGTNCMDGNETIVQPTVLVGYGNESDVPTCILRILPDRRLLGLQTAWRPSERVGVLWVCSEWGSLLSFASSVPS